MNINKPLIVFGRDAAETYPLLLAIARRRERDEARTQRRDRIKNRLLALMRAPLGVFM